jgi:hypothetical protein
MTGHTSIWRLSRQLGTYPELLAGLCLFHELELVDGVRGREVRNEDVKLVSDLLYAWKSRPKLSYLSGRAPRRQPKPKPTRRAPQLV